MANDYNELDNLPKIGGKEIKGEQLPSYYGLATSQEVETYVNAQIASLPVDNIKGSLDVLNGEIIDTTGLDKINYAIDSKELIKSAIIAKNGLVTDDTTLREFADKIALIPGNATALIKPTLVTQSGSFSSDGLWTIPEVNSVIDSSSGNYITVQSTAFTWASLVLNSTTTKHLMTSVTQVLGENIYLFARIKASSLTSLTLLPYQSITAIANTLTFAGLTPPSGFTTDSNTTIEVSIVYTITQTTKTVITLKNVYVRYINEVA